MMVLAYIDPRPIIEVGGWFSFVLAGLASWLVVLATSIRRLVKEKKHRRRLYVLLVSITVLGMAVVYLWNKGNGTRITPEVEKAAMTRQPGRIIVLGFDGFSPSLAEPMLEAGELPALASLSRRGSYSRLKTTNPAQSPVAWTTFATGLNPGRHGICGFIGRKPGTYLPDLVFGQQNGMNFSRPTSAGRAFWHYANELGISVTVLSCPMTFPPEEIEGKLLAGMGVPDLLGTQGTFAFYTTRKQEITELTGGEVYIVDRADDMQLHFYGPKARGLTGAVSRLEAPLSVHLLPDGYSAEITTQADRFVLTAGQWSEWVTVEFRAGPFRKLSAITRLYLNQVTPEFELYVSPLSLDPRKPLWPISYPKAYSRELAGDLGLYPTRGMPYDTWALNEERIPDEAFLAHARTILHSRIDILKRELREKDKGVLFAYFEYPDVIQHMFWRSLASSDGKRQVETPQASRDAIHTCYKEMDSIAEFVIADMTETDTLIVLSDHGFTCFDYALHLNTWLYQRGLLALREGSEPGPNATQGDIDWEHTRAYAIGLSGIYLNLRGREPQGIVSPGAEEEALTAALCQALEKWECPDSGQVVLNAYQEKEIMTGTAVEDGPDIYLGLNHGFRISWETALGGVPAATMEKNTRKWSGTHLVDPTIVPGVLFTSFRTKSECEPSIADLAPTILKLMGATPQFISRKAMDGVPLL